MTLQKMIWNWFCRKENRLLPLLFALVWALVILLGCRVQQRDVALAENRGREAALQELSASVVEPEDPEPTEDDEAALLARMLYGYYQAGATRADQWELIAWVAVNRAEAALWPSELRDVLLQPEQWQGFSEENPILQDILTVAEDVLDTWHSGGARPLAPEFVYLAQSGTRTQVRTEYIESGSCRYVER